MAPDGRPVRLSSRLRAPARCLPVVLALALGAAVGPAQGQSLASRARETGCSDPPRLVEGANYYRCNTANGVAFFNLPASAGGGGGGGVGGGGGASRAAAASPTPGGFPRVDADTQKGRDEMRRKVLGDEIAAEEKLLAESKAAYANGAPVATAEERANPQRYAERIAKLRDAVRLHERNIELLRKELATAR